MNNILKNIHTTNPNQQGRVADPSWWARGCFNPGSKPLPGLKELESKKIKEKRDE